MNNEKQKTTEKLVEAAKAGAIAAGAGLTLSALIASMNTAPKEVKPQDIDTSPSNTATVAETAASPQSVLNSLGVEEPPVYDPDSIAYNEEYEPQQYNADLAKAEQFEGFTAWPVTDGDTLEGIVADYYNLSDQTEIHNVAEGIASLAINYDVLGKRANEHLSDGYDKDGFPIIKSGDTIYFAD